MATQKCGQETSDVNHLDHLAEYKICATGAMVARPPPCKFTTRLSAGTNLKTYETPPFRRAGGGVSVRTCCATILPAPTPVPVAPPATPSAPSPVSPATRQSHHFFRPSRSPLQCLPKPWQTPRAAKDQVVESCVPWKCVPPGRKCMIRRCLAGWERGRGGVERHSEEHCPEKGLRYGSRVQRVPLGSHLNATLCSQRRLSSVCKHESPPTLETKNVQVFEAFEAGPPQGKIF